MIFSLSPVDEIKLELLADKSVRLYLKRDDLIHPQVSGNKWRKLKYNLLEAANQNQHTILTLGGAFSNHIAATAFASKAAGLNSIGVIRGEYDANNPTIRFAEENGMLLHFVSRDAYREKTEPAFIKELEDRFGGFYMVPEGGANGLGVKGCAEILPEIEVPFDIVCCASGTATTSAGLALTLKKRQRLLAFPALKVGGFLFTEMQRLIDEARLRPPSKLDVEFITNYHFGGYAKLNSDLLEFIDWFKAETNILLDPIYTGKMMYGLFDLIKSGYFKSGTNIVAIHTGGIQGWDGMKYRGLA